MPVGERECGNKDRRKRKEMERGSLVQPSITFMGFKFVWLHFSLKHTEQERERGARGGGSGGGWRKTEGVNSKRRVTKIKQQTV